MHRAVLSALVISRHQGRSVGMWESGCTSSLINGTLLQVLSHSEVDWINSYHKDVWEKVSPRIKDSKVLKWLEDNTQTLQVPQMVPA